MSKLCSLNARPPSAEGNRSTIAHLCPSSLRTQRSARTARRSTTNALAGRADFRDGGGCVIPSASPRATTRRPGGRALRRRPAVASKAAPGPPRGRALPGRRDDARAPAWLGGANPERTAHERPSRPGTRQHERARQEARAGTGRHRPGGGIHLDTVEVTAVPSTVDQRRRRRVKCTCTHPSAPAPRRGDGGLRCERRAKARGIGHSRPGSWDGSWDELQTLGGRRGPERPSKGPGRTLGDAAAHAGSRPPEAGAQVRILPGAPLSA